MKKTIIVINLKEELKKGAHIIDLPSLFTGTYAYLNYKQKREKKK